MPAASSSGLGEGRQRLLDAEGQREDHRHQHGRAQALDAAGAAVRRQAMAEHHIEHEQRAIGEGVEIAERLRHPARVGQQTRRRRPPAPGRRRCAGCAARSPRAGSAPGTRWRRPSPAAGGRSPGRRRSSSPPASPPWRRSASARASTPRADSAAAGATARTRSPRSRSAATPRPAARSPRTAARRRTGRDSGTPRSPRSRRAAGCGG